MYDTALIKITYAYSKFELDTVFQENKNVITSNIGVLVDMYTCFMKINAYALENA